MLPDLQDDVEAKLTFLVTWEDFKCDTRAKCKWITPGWCLRLGETGEIMWPLIRFLTLPLAHICEKRAIYSLTSES